ncbi:hypothetical protein SEA_PHEROBRINE_65 [Gordonia phage Pherobrine]|nr:hypothetical protein SEA_PHEROBRINE_65 [Gordonia phage Pherobrine]
MGKHFRPEGEPPSILVNPDLQVLQSGTNVMIAPRDVRLPSGRHYDRTETEDDPSVG